MEEDRQSIRDLVLRYCRAVDVGDLQEVRSCFHPSATVHRATYAGNLNGFLEWVAEEISKYRQTMHFAGNHYVEVSEGRAVSETYVVVTHVRHQPQDPANFTSGVRYVDYLERVKGAWVILERWAVREWVRSENGRLLPSAEPGGRAELASARRRLAGASPSVS